MKSPDRLAYNSDKPERIQFEQINSFITRPNMSQGQSPLSGLIQRALELRASDLHIDWLNGYYTISIRIDKKLHYINKLSLEQGQNLASNIKHELQISPSTQTKPWSGKSPEIFGDTVKQYETHVIPFNPLESIIVRLQPQKPAQPTWTDVPGIHKKIFIWQMGKVGSSTVLSSLKPHTNNYDNPNGTNISDEPFCQYNNIIHTHSAKPIYHALHHSDEEFIVISPVRDLLQRNISAIFQSMADETPSNQYFIAPTKELQKWSSNQLHTEIASKLLALNLNTHLVHWYDVLFKSHMYYPDVDRYHIDIYSKPFDKRKGMQIYESKTPRIKLLIIRLENLNNLEKELGDFFGIEKFSLCLNNIASNKWYKDTYQQFKKVYKPTQQEYEHIYSSKFMNYFYSFECGDNQS